MTGQQSALYEGTIRHRRVDPIEHSFRYPIFMAYLDLAELPEVLDPLPGWSARRPALARFKRSDHLGDVTRPLDECVRDLVAAENGVRPAGPIRMLANLRYFGHCFNPVSFFFCFNECGESVDAVLAEVNNTPWGESHAYVIGGADSSRVIRGRVSKDFHVSPMMGMDHVYEWRRPCRATISRSTSRALATASSPSTRPFRSSAASSSRASPPGCSGATRR